MSVSAAASLLKLSNWSQYSSAQLAKKLEGLQIAPRPGKPRRQAQLNLWEMGRAWIPKSKDSSSTAAAAEDRLVELYGLRASEARDLAIKYGIVSAAEASHTRLFDLVKLIFVYEFMVARPADLANLPAPSVEGEPSASASAAAAAGATANPKVSIPTASSTPVDASVRVFRDKARMVRYSLGQVNRDLSAVINTMENEFGLENETIQ